MWVVIWTRPPFRGPGGASLRGFFYVVQQNQVCQLLSSFHVLVRIVKNGGAIGPRGRPPIFTAAKDEIVDAICVWAAQGVLQPAEALH